MQAGQYQVTSRWRRWILVVGLLLGAVLFIQQLQQAYFAVSATRSDTLLPGWLLVALCAVLLGTLLQVSAWVTLMGGLGVSLRWRNVVWGYIFSFIPRYLPGSVWGYLSRGEWLYQTYRVSRRVTAISSVLEILASALTVCMLVAFHQASHWVSLPVLALIIVLLILAAAGAGWLVNAALGWSRLAWPLSEKPVGQPIRMPLLDWARSISIYIMFWACYGVAIAAILLAFGQPGAERWFELGADYGAAWLVGLVVIIAPTGLGAREWAFSSLMQSAFGFAQAQASLVSVVARFVILSTELVWAALWIGGAGLSRTNGGWADLTLVVRRILRRILPARLYTFLAIFSPVDLMASAAFVFSQDLGVPFVARVVLVGKLYWISLRIESPHTQAEILSYIRSILRLPLSMAGVLVEAGCYKGSSTAKLSLAAQMVGRTLVVFDSFQGIPANTEPHDQNIYGQKVSFGAGDFRATLGEVKSNIARFGRIDRCQFVPGWFEDTLPIFHEQAAAIFLDVDLAASTQTCLKYLYPLLQPGGVLWSQDGHIPLVLEVFRDPQFWTGEVGCIPPFIHGLGKRKLLCIVKGESASMHQVSDGGE